MISERNFFCCAVVVVVFRLKYTRLSHHETREDNYLWWSEKVSRKRIFFRMKFMLTFDLLQLIRQFFKV